MNEFRITNKLCNVIIDNLKEDAFVSDSGEHRYMIQRLLKYNDVSNETKDYIYLYKGDYWMETLVRIET